MALRFVVDSNVYLEMKDRSGLFIIVEMLQICARANVLNRVAF